MTEPGEPGKGATSYALLPKGSKSLDGKSKVKPAPFELVQMEGGIDKVKDREKDQDDSVTVSRKGTKIGHRRIDEDGQITYKKQPSSALVSAIQLGIQYSVGRLSSKVERDVLMGDFYEIESVFFPSDGQQETPAHHYSDFRFKAYAPVAFRYFRELFHIAPDDFLISLCHEPLREITNPGASGSLFYVSMDDQFIIKTVQHKEADFLQKLLPGYYLNLNQNKRTLLPKFFGLYCYQCGGKNIRLVLMNNLLPSGYKIHSKYDLKGSTYKRKASKAERAKSSPTLKDLDFMTEHPEGGIFLDSDTYTLLIKTIQRDCRVLESFKIMDYSLLLAIHNVDEAARERREARGEASSTTRSKTSEATAANNDEGRKASEKSTEEQAKGVSPTVARNPSARNRDDFAAYWEAIPQHRDDTPYGAIRARNARGDRLLLFIGIIDILQSYRLKKRLEHGLKSVVQDGDAISVHRPSFYAKRFQEFMSEKVFRKAPGNKTTIARSPSKKRASFNTGRGRIRTSSDTDKHVNRVEEKNLASKPTLSPSLDAGLANVVPGDVSFMGRGTKSLDASLLVAAQGLPTDSHEHSTITHEVSSTTYDESTTTHAESTVNRTTYEQSVQGGHSGSEVPSITLTHSTPQKTTLVDVGHANKQISQQEQAVPTVKEVHADVPTTSNQVPETSGGVTNTSPDAIPSTSYVPKSSVDMPSTSDAPDTSDVLQSTSNVPGRFDGISNSSDVVPKISISTVPDAVSSDCDNEGSNDLKIAEIFVQVSGNNEETSEHTDSLNGQSSTKSEPAVLDSKI